jgi:adenylyl cyclase-associated protein
MSLDNAIQALVKRLETVTARLEQVEKQLASGGPVGAAPAGGSGDDGDSSASVADFDNLISDYINHLVKVTGVIGSDELKTQVGLLEKAVQEQRKLLVIASKSKKPDDAALGKLLQPTSDLMQQIGAIRDKHRTSKQFNHLSTLSEGISCLGWVAVSPTPVPFVNDARASSEFYSNKILVEFKKSNEDQVNWVQAWNNFMKELATYIKKNHTTGLTWNPRGGDASSASASAPAAAPKAGGGPPPPPPPAPISDAPAGSDKGAAPDTGALFAAINKGTGISSGLKHVTKEMKNKNRADVPSVVPAAAAEKKPAAAPKAAAAVKKGVPKLEITGNKWVVEWQENNNNIEIKETEPKQTVYIYKCEKSVVRITGKINNVTLDSCKRVAVVFSDAVAACEVVNSNSVEIQVTGKVPSIAIDKCSGVQVFLSKDGLGVEIVSSKSDQMNVLIPDPAGGPDPIEIAVPEQYKTVVKDNKLVTTTVEHV